MKQTRMKWPLLTLATLIGLCLAADLDAAQLTKRWGENSNCDYTGVTEDTYIDQGQPTYNMGAEAHIRAGDQNPGGGRPARTLIKFDFSALQNLISSSSQIVSATLKIKTYEDPGNDETVDVFRVKKNWYEGNNEYSVADEADDEVTWNHQVYSETAWSTAGCDGTADRDSTADDSVTLSDVNTWYTWDVTDSVKTMFNNTQYYGWVLAGQNEYGSLIRKWIFYSSEHTTAADRPYLEITYEPTVNYRSIGTNSGTLYNTGNASISSGNKTVTFAGGASLPVSTAVPAVGPGDKLTLDPGGVNEEVLYILSRDSNTQVTVQTAAVNSHTSESYTIKRAYNTIAAWEGVRSGDLVADKRREVGVCYKDGVFNELVTIDGSTTNATHYLTLTVAEGQRHNGTEGTGVIWKNSSDKTARVIQIKDPYTRIEWIEFDGSTMPSGDYDVVSFQADNITASNLIVHDVSGDYIEAIEVYSGGANSHIYDCIAYNVSGTSSALIVINVSGVTIDNCTFYNGSDRGVDNRVSSTVVRNTISMNAANEDFYGTYDSASDNNLASDGTAPGTDIDTGTTASGTTTTTVKLDSTAGISAGDWFNNTTRSGSSRIASVDDGTTLTLSGAITGQTSGDSYKIKHSAHYRIASNNFVSTTSGSEDLHLKSGADAIDTGTNLSSTFTNDIDGETRGGTWDMGADEYYPLKPFNYRKPLTFKYSQRGTSCGESFTLENFPVLVSLSGTWLKTTANGGHVYSPSGYDIIFRASDGKTQLSHEIEKYDGENGTLVAWVKIPDLFDGNADTKIYIVYGNSDITTDISNPAGVWNSNFTAVYHLKEHSGNQKDSTSNGIHLTNLSLSEQGTAVGIANGADRFNAATNRYADTNSTSAFDVASGDSLTVEAWIKTSTTGVYQFVVNRKDTDGDPTWQLLVDDSNTANFRFSDGSGHSPNISSTNTVTNDTFRYLVGRWDGSAKKVEIFVDGSYEDSAEDDQVGANSVTRFLRVGQEGDDNGGYGFTGNIDEVRISNGYRDDCWIETSYKAIKNYSTFYTEGVEESFYAYRKPLTLNYSQRGSECGTSYDLSDFPVLIKLEGSWLRTRTSDPSNGRIYSSDGWDIIFRGPDDNTQLSHEIEKYDGSAEGGSLIAWVKIPALFDGNADTTIYMYYGKSDLTGPTENPTGVWNSNYVAVYHLKETSPSQHYDSTGNDNDSTSVSVATQGTADGKIDGADYFNGTSSQIAIGDKESQHITNAITIEAWIHPDSVASKGRIVTKSDERFVLRVNNEQSAMLDGYVDEGGTLKHAQKSSILVTTGYQHVAMSWASSGTAQPIKLYYNGSEVTNYYLQQSATSPLNTSTNPLYIGSHGSGEYFDGRMDEIRISKIARDACWIGTTYKSIYNYDSFVTAGQEADLPTGIELSSFAARGEGSTVLVEWRTKTEVDNLGFNLYRSTEREGTYTKLNSSLISGLVSSVKGRSYSFTDSQVTKGKVYYYKLEDIDLKGKRTVHGPVCVDWDRDGIPDDVDPEVRVSDSGTGGASGGGGISQGGDISDGDFWVYGDSTVTRVNLKGFKAHDTREGVLVEWQTGYEVDNLGFHLYREVDGEVVRLTPELVAGSALLAGSGTSLRAGHQYRWLDTNISFQLSAVSDQHPLPSPPPSRGRDGVGGTQSLALSPQSSAFSGGRSAVGGQRSVVRYWLEDVDLNGKRTWHGPVEALLPAPSSPLQASEVRRAELMSEFGKKLDKRYEEFWKAQELREKLKNVNRSAPPPSPSPLEGEGRGGGASVGGRPSAVGGRRTNIVVSTVDEDHGSLIWGRVYTIPSDKPPKAFPGVQQALASGPALKLLVREEGWYRVSRAELQGAGLSSRVNPQFLRLYTEGVEVPLGIISDSPGRPISWEAIEFYGGGLDTSSTDTRVYWLVEGRQPGKRLQLSHGQAGQKGAASFPYTVEKKDRMIYFAGLRNGDESNFFGPIIYQASADQLLEVRHLDLAASGDAALEIRIQGVTALPHRVNVFINDIGVGTLTWEGQTLKTAVFSLPQSYLLEGENLVTLAAVGGETDMSLLDSIRLTYWRTYRAYEDELRCRAQGGTQVSIDGFSTPEVRVFDITDAGAFFEVETKGNLVDTGYRVTFRVPGSGTRTLLALTDQKMKTPAGIRANEPSSWRKAGGYDLVMVSHGDFIDSLSSLETLRRSQGLSVGVVDIEDVYDEFSFGMKSPQALKDFLSHAKSSWSRPPRFVLLVGDASYDPRNFTGYGELDFVPTKLIDTVYLETASDDWFVDFDDDGLPEMAIGRLPVQTAEEAAMVVSKLIGYEQSIARKEAILVADRADNPNDFNFEGGSEEVRALLPGSILVRKIFRGQFGSDAQARAELLSGMNQGPLLVNFMGHGSLEVWRGDLLTVNDAENLINGLQLPLFVNMTCLNGFFQAPYADSMAEALLKAQGGGAVAVWTSSGMTEPDKQAVMNKELIRLLFNGQGLTLGEATKRAKAAVTDQDIRKTWILFGDPSTRLK